MPFARNDAGYDPGSHTGRVSGAMAARANSSSLAERARG
jgi:hypothetical protein